MPAATVAGDFGMRDPPEPMVYCETEFPVGIGGVGALVVGADDDALRVGAGRHGCRRQAPNAPVFAVLYWEIVESMSLAT